MLGLVDPQFIAEIFDAVFAKDYAKLVEYTKLLEDYESEMVVDELIAYLKEKMYNQDALFSTLVLDRFFRILSESKYLFSINADGSFVLSMIFFKMIEALKVREIDQMIESFQKEITRPELAIPSAQQTAQTKESTDKTQPQTAKVKVQATTPEMKGEVAPVEEPQPITQTKEPEIEPQAVPPAPQKDIGLEKFRELIAKIQDRNYALAECFENNIFFVSFSDETLTWESCADEECKKALKHGYGVIKQLVREVFSFNTKIKGLPCSKPAQEQAQKVETPQPTEVIEGAQSASTVEDVEIGGGASCVAGCDEPSVVDEINGDDITKEPMVQKAIEMFEAKKVTIQSKI
jgi:DNA polymerase-3 subunit gamma/tau